MKTVLVTGAAGYIGQHLLQAWAQSHETAWYGLSRSPAPIGFHGTWIVQDLATLALPDLCRLLDRLQPDVVFHGATAPRNATLADHQETTVPMTTTLIRALHEVQPACRVIVPGSAAEYGPLPTPVSEETPPRPVTAYGQAKCLQTQEALTLGEQTGIPVIVARLFNVYGATPPHFAVAAMAHQIARLEQAVPDSVPTLTVHNLESLRDFIHIRDTVSALMQLAERGTPGRIYNVAAGQSVSLAAVLENLLALSTLPPVKCHPLSPQAPDPSLADITRIRQEIGWWPQVTLEEGLLWELAYWRHIVAQNTPATVEGGV